MVPFALPVACGWLAFLLFNVAAAARGDTRPVLMGIEIVAATASLVIGRFAERRVAFHAIAAVSAAGLVASSWVAGDGEAVAYWMLMLIPPLAASEIGPRAGIAWAGACIAGAALAVADPLGLPDEGVPPVAARFLAVVILIVLSARFALLARRREDDRVEAVKREAAARSELLATISHEIRTPLHGVVGTANVLAESDLPSEQRELVDTLVRSAATVRRIVDDVLDMARIESNKLPIHPEPTDVWTLLEDVVDLYASEAGARGVELALVIAPEASLHVELDRTRLLQIVNNLVGNAVKFTKRGSIVVRASSEAGRASDRVRLTIVIEDTGPGFPSDALSRPFAAFSQPDAALARLHGGSGLGLSLAHDLASRMNGALRIDPAYASGARVEVVLEDVPLTARTAEAAPSAPTVRGLAIEPSVVGRDALSTSLRDVAGLALDIVELDDVAKRVTPELRFVLAPLDNDRASRLTAILEAHPGVALLHASTPGSPLATPPGAAAILRRPYRRSRLAMLARQFSTAPAEPSAELPVIVVRRAYVVDDDPASRRVLAAMLHRRGYLVTSLASGAETIEIARVGPLPDIVFSDLHMPGMNGIDVATALRALRGERSQPRLVVVSATVRDDDRRQCRDAGFDAFLDKPFAVAALDEILDGVPATATSTDAPTETLLDRGQLDSVMDALGDEALEAFAEQDQMLSARLEELARLGESGGPAFVAAAHAIASSALQVGFHALGTRAREVELSPPPTAADRGIAVNQLRGLVLRTRAELLRVTMRTSPPFGVKRVSAMPSARDPLPVVRVSLEGEVSAERLLRRLSDATSAAAARHSVLIDGRSSEPTSPDVGSAFESWYRSPPSTVAKIAMIVSNRLWIPHIEARAKACPIPMRVFEQEADAIAWLAIE